jgi:DUF4097 and DUF4098 domain-containing protein YvlB
MLKAIKKTRMKRVLLGVVACLGLLSIFAGGARTQSEQKLSEEFHQTYPLAAGGRVSLENINGSVRISAWDRNEVKVDAVKWAYKRERLTEAKIEVSATASSVYIKTDYPDRNLTFNNGDWNERDNPATVEYTLTVPRGARLDSIELINGGIDISGVAGDVKASSINGRVQARGLTGEAKLATINGRLEATFDRLDVSKPISLASVNGSVALTIPSDSNAELKANTVHGGISNDFGLPVRKGKYVGRELAGLIGQGGPRIKLDNVNGSITISHAADGRPLSPATNYLPDRSDDDGDDAEIERGRAEARREAREAQREVERAQVEIQRESQRAAREALREHDEAIRESQREAIRAQAEAQRATRNGTRTDNVIVNNNTMRVTSNETKTFSVSGTPRVTLQTFDGPISVRTWDKQEVTVNALKRAGDEHQKQGIRVNMSQSGADISVVADFDKAYAQRIMPGVSNISANVSLEVYVPRNTTLRAVSGDGRILIEGVNGELDLRTGDGSIEVQNARGHLNATTGDGRIRIINYDGQVETRTGDGSISLSGRFDQLSARTGDGSISLALPTNARATIETDSESVINDVGAVEEDTSSKRLHRWRVGGGGTVFRLHTGDGRIVLRRADDNP